MKKVLLAMVMLFALGCDVNPSKLGKRSMDGFVDSIAYVKDKKTGLCFAIVASRKTGDLNQTGLGLTHVPCESIKGQ